MQNSHSRSITLPKGRLEAFSDGVIAIIITIMVLELKVPHTTDWSALRSLAPIFLSYVLSFIYVAIYWNNHHHLFQIIKHVNGKIMWANAHLLFWLSLLPFVTAWSGENHFAPLPVATYGIVLFMCAMAYYILVRVLVASHPADSDIANAFGRDVKGKISSVLCGTAIVIAFFLPYVALLLYATVAAIWVVPDKRVEKVLIEKHSQS